MEKNIRLLTPVFLLMVIYFVPEPIQSERIQSLGNVTKIIQEDAVIKCLNDSLKSSSSASSSLHWFIYKTTKTLINASNGFNMSNVKYRIVSNTCDLTVKNLTVTDGASYCYTTNTSNTTYCSNLVVYDLGLPTVRSWNGSTVTMQCCMSLGSTATYRNNFFPLSLEQLPKMSLLFDGMQLNSTSPQDIRNGGSYFCIRATRIVTSSDSRKNMTCRISAMNPVLDFARSIPLPLNPRPQQTSSITTPNSPRGSVSRSTTPPTKGSNSVSGATQLKDSLAVGLSNGACFLVLGAVFAIGIIAIVRPQLLKNSSSCCQKRHHIGSEQGRELPSFSPSSSSSLSSTTRLDSSIVNPSSLPPPAYSSIWMVQCDGHDISACLHQIVSPPSYEEAVEEDPKDIDLPPPYESQ